MGITGAWINGYGSIMSLAQSEGGLVYGIYSSSTGSTGVYHVLGWGTPGPPPPTGEGPSLALSIFWRPIKPEKPDSSWHWVSSLGGQSVTMNGLPLLVLTHAMVATDDFGQINVGTYLDKLIYQPYLGQAGEAVRPRASGTPAADPINGTWICEQIPGLTLQIRVEDGASGLVGGTLTTPQGGFALHGFADTYASREALSLEGLSVAADLGANLTTSFAGSLDIRTGLLSLLQMKSTGTLPSSTYAQTAGQGLYFRRS